MDRLNTLSTYAWVCLIACILLNLSSYFIYVPLIFTWLLVALVFVFALVLVFTRPSSQWKFELHELKYYRIIIMLFGWGALMLTMFQLGDLMVEDRGSDYILKARTTFIRIATEAEYHLYIRRITRMFTGGLMFLYPVFTINKDSKAKS